MAGEIGFYSLEKRFVRADGRVIWISMRSSTVRDADDNFLYGVRVVQDITERKEAEERQKLLVDELNHRVKNTLATVQSLATQTARGTDSPDALPAGVRGPADRAQPSARSVDAPALAQRRPARHRRPPSSRPTARGAQDRIAIEATTSRSRPRAALTLAMALHELTTNAAKYGALSTPAGRIDVGWRVVREPSQPPRALALNGASRAGRRW